MEDVEEPGNEADPFSPEICDGGRDRGKSHKQTYRKAWENLPDFKGWLRGVDGQPGRASCSYCCVTLFAHRLSLLKHTCTLKHQKAAQKVLLQKSVSKSNGSTETISSATTSTANTDAYDEAGGLSNSKLSLKNMNLKLDSGVTVRIIQEPEDQMQLQVNEPTEIETEPVISEAELNKSKHTDSSLTVEIQEGDEELSFSQNKVGLPPKAPLRIMAQSNNSSPLSTHVLDTARGQPAAGIQVSLYRLIEGRWTLVNEGVTNSDGRCVGLIQKPEFVAGRYKLHFDTDKYFELQRKDTLYPFVEIAFDVHAPQEHYHIPLLLSPFGYTTYRGS